MLEGKRILIVEDEPLIALDLEAAVIDCRGTVVGPARTIAEANRIAELETLDGAILDLRLEGGVAISVAERLRARGIAFVVHSGQADATAARAWPDVPFIDKPALPEKVISVLASVMRGGQ